LSVLFLFTFVLIAPTLLSTSASNDGAKSGSERFVDYDIRTAKNPATPLSDFRNSAQRTASEIADLRDGFVNGENVLRTNVSTLKVDYNSDLKIPEMIGTNVKLGRSFLTAPSTGKRSDLLVKFLTENESLVGVSNDQIAGLKVAADYKNPEGELAFVELNQEIDGVPVFRGEVKAGLTKKNEIVRVINNLAPGIDLQSVSKDFGEPSNAVKAAAESIQHPLSGIEKRLNGKESSVNKLVFGSGDFATSAEKMYFPTEPGVVVPAWRILIWQPIAAYYIIVDAARGTLLWRKNISDDQTTSATYNVYANPNAMINVAENPFPFTPGPTSPNGTQGLPIARTLVTRIGNEVPYTFNNLGWITDGNNTTDGNNVEAGLDRELPNPAVGVGIDPNSQATGGPNRTFNFPINPGVPTNPAAGTGDAPLPAGQTPTVCQAEGTATAPTNYQKAVVTQLFYVSNWYHDETYRLGFTEQARNFQNDNFGRGGEGSDRVSAEAQDCVGSNNANFNTPADGGRGRMQMFIWTAPTPDFDGSLDGDVVIHELTHGLSNRLHGNASGLSGLNMSRALGEGWSDFYAHAMLSEPADPINGTYALSGYARYGAVSSFNNYYYGIRRFPKAVMAFTGPNGMPHNPLTFNDIDPTKADLSDGAFAPGFNTTADGVHAGGEIWSSALWEIRARYITRLEWEAGNRRILQHITDGMKLAPLLPTFLSERDAIIAGVLASGTAADVEDMWAGFALRGLGASASIQNSGGLDAFGSGTGLTRVTEAFDLPKLELSEFSISDQDFGNGNGTAEPGELVSINYTITNNTGRSSGNISIAYDNIAESYPGIAHAESVTVSDQYSVSPQTACGSLLTFNVQLTGVSLGTANFQRSIAVGRPVETFSENFDSVTAPAFPSGWTVASTFAPMTFVTTTNGPDSAPNSAFAADLPNCTGAGCSTTDGGGTDLTSPLIPITSQSGLVSFRHRFNTEFTWDGGVLEISTNGGPFQDIVTAGGVFLENGYNSALGVSNPNPLGGRQGWSGDSGGYQTTVVRLPVSTAGQSIRLRWRFGTDSNTAPENGGWNIDSVSVSGSAVCSAVRVSIGGRVVDQLGRGISKATVTISNGTTTRRVGTNSFGYFLFVETPGGVPYTITATAKRYVFTPQQVTPTTNIEGLIFIGS